MKTCPFCHKDILRDDAASCPVCRRDLVPPSPPAPPPSRRALLAPDVDPPAAALLRVSVVDINMPFASMVGFMVKWAIAAIPAVLILVVLGALLTAAFAGVGSALR
jgi:hypothetical protein